jgi:hypothetical protein
MNRLEKDAIKTWLGYFSADGVKPGNDAGTGAN